MVDNINVVKRNGRGKEPLNIENGFLHLPNKPGLGFDLNFEYIEAHSDPDWN